MPSATPPVIALDSLPRGDARDYRGQVFTDPSQITPADLTNCTLAWAAALASGGGPVISKTVGAGIVLDDQTVVGVAGSGRGWFTLSLEHADTARLPAASTATALAWSLQLVGPDGRPRTCAEGSVQIVNYPTS